MLTSPVDYITTIPLLGCVNEVLESNEFVILTIQSDGWTMMMVWNQLLLFLTNLFVPVSLTFQSSFVTFPSLLPVPFVSLLYIFPRTFPFYVLPNTFYAVSVLTLHFEWHRTYPRPVWCCREAMGTSLWPFRLHFLCALIADWTVYIEYLSCFPQSFSSGNVCENSSHWAKFPIFWSKNKRREILWQ
jgi:hypothetical protein